MLIVNSLQFYYLLCLFITEYILSPFGLVTLLRLILSSSESNMPFRELCLLNAEGLGLRTYELVPGFKFSLFISNSAPVLYPDLMP